MNKPLAWGVRQKAINHAQPDRTLNSGSDFEETESTSSNVVDRENTQAMSSVLKEATINQRKGRFRWTRCMQRGVRLATIDLSSTTALQTIGAMAVFRLHVAHVSQLQRLGKRDVMDLDEDFL